jgi:hypothetical protein
MTSDIRVTTAQILLGFAKLITQYDASMDHHSSNPWKFVEQKKTNKLIFCANNIIRLKESKMDLWRGFGNGKISSVLSLFPVHIPFSAVKKLELYLAKTEILQKKKDDIMDDITDNGKAEISIEEGESASDSDNDDTQSKPIIVTYEGSATVRAFKKKLFQYKNFTYSSTVECCSLTVWIK